MSDDGIVSTLRQLAVNVVSKAWLEREIAFFIDVVISSTIAIFPSVGWIAGLLYFFFRDALPFGNGRSFGKSVYDLVVVCNDTDAPLRTQWRNAIVRNLILFIPILNLFDIYYFLLRGRRLADDWTNTRVVKRNQL